MNPLDSYLARVARELRSMPQAKRDDELRELRYHLEQRAEDFDRLKDLSPETAARSAHPPRVRFTPFPRFQTLRCVGGHSLLAVAPHFDFNRRHHPVVHHSCCCYG